jgi:hypothetical protein
MRRFHHRSQLKLTQMLAIRGAISKLHLKVQEARDRGLDSKSSLSNGNYKSEHNGNKARRGGRTVWQVTTGAVSRRVVGDMGSAVQYLYRNGRSEYRLQSSSACSPANEPKAGLSYLQRQGVLQAEEGRISEHMTRWAEYIHSRSIFFVTGKIQRSVKEVMDASVYRVEI